MNLKLRQKLLAEKISPLIKKEGFEMFGFSLFRSSRGLSLRVLVDFPQGGISLEECASLNRELYLYLEQSGLMEEEYNLEVSSPGILRRYTHPRDLRRVKGRQIRVKALEEGEIKEYQGVCLGIAGELRQELKLETETGLVSIPLDSIKDAKEKL